MARLSRKQVEANRERILAAAGRRLRERGIEAVSINDLMRDAGLTHGGFYNHFANKEALVHAALTAEGDARWDGAAAFVDRYLSAAHRDDAGGGCVFAALGSEVARGAHGVRHALTQRLLEGVERVAEAAEGATEAARRQAAMGAWAAMVGGLVLSRMVDDPALSDEILAAARAMLPVGGGARP